jgi:hypothetical protein
MECPNCQRTTEHRHLHDTAHGIPETHLDGSERYECAVCGYSMRRAEGEGQGLRFVCDTGQPPAKMGARRRS